MVHRDLVETWEPSVSVRTPSYQFVPGHKIVVIRGAELDQEGFIEQICDDGTAFVRIGANQVSYCHVQLADCLTHPFDSTSYLSRI